jgi:hypothetical protein
VTNAERREVMKRRALAELVASGPLAFGDLALALGTAAEGLLRSALAELVGAGRVEVVRGWGCTELVGPGAGRRITYRARFYSATARRGQRPRRATQTPAEG